MNYKAWFQAIQDGFFSFNKALNFSVEIDLDKEEIDDLICPNNNPLIRSYKADMEKDSLFLLTFDGDMQNGWFGFNRFFRTEIQGKKALLQAEIPKMYFQPEETCSTCSGEGFISGKICLLCSGAGKTKKICANCDGTGNSKYYEKCLMCHGTGFERPKPDWSVANFVIANLSLLFRFLNAKSDDNQNLKPIVIFHNNPYSVGVGAVLKTTVAEWIYSALDKNCSSVRKRMLDTLNYEMQFQRINLDNSKLFGLAKFSHCLICKL